MFRWSPFVSFISSDFYCYNMPCYFYIVKLPSFPPYSKCKDLVPLNFFQELLLCAIDCHVDASWKLHSYLTSSNRGLKTLYILLFLIILTSYYLHFQSYYTSFIMILLTVTIDLNSSQALYHVNHWIKNH